MHTPESPVSLQCDDCGDWFSVSARQARTVRAAGPGYVCQRCRATRKRRPRPKVTEAERQYWIERFGLTGAIELSISIWGPAEKKRRAPRLEVELLAASAHPR